MYTLIPILAIDNTLITINLKEKVISSLVSWPLVYAHLPETARTSSDSQPEEPVFYSEWWGRVYANFSL